MRPERRRSAEFSCSARSTLAGIGISGALLAPMAFAPAGCAERNPVSPFTPPSDAGLDATPEAGEPGIRDGSIIGPGGKGADPSLGGPCLDDAQCDDGIDCTIDRCDAELKRCRREPEHASCDDGIYCNGEELCDFGDGCSPGEPVSCSDDDTCTIDVCIEETQSCEHRPRDADGDGDAVWNCEDGGDCDDTDPLINSNVGEVCGNQRDDDCDGVVDEDDCSAPQYDRCSDPLLVETDGQYSISSMAAGADYAASCLDESETYRDLVLAVRVPDDEIFDIDIVAQAEVGGVVLAATEACGEASAETDCAQGLSDQEDLSVARLRLRARGPGAHGVIVLTERETDVNLSVSFLPPEDKPENETCTTAEPLPLGKHVEAQVFDALSDVESACDANTGELFYSLELEQASDLVINGIALDRLGIPMLSLRSPTCVPLEEELTCRASNPARLFKRNLPPGTYLLSVAASGHTVVDVFAERFEPTSAPAGDSCEQAEPLLPGESVDLDFSDREDTLQSACLAGAPDAVHALHLEEASDVLAVQRLSTGESGALALMRPGCELVDSIACSISDESPTRLSLSGLEPGDYRIVSETLLGGPAQLTLFARRAREPVLVPFADRCEDAFEIPEGGGVFTGNTSQANADYSAGCDQGFQTAGGAPEQMLKLHLTEPRRVIFDMKGSSYETLLDVREGPECPGREIARGCVPGYVENRSFLDVTLGEGEYYVQVDGYGGDQGAWVLNVFSEPL